MTSTAKPTVYCDVTMLVEAHGPAHGILRVMREATLLLTSGDARIVPCAYDFRTHELRAIDNWVQFQGRRDATPKASPRLTVRHFSAPQKHSLLKRRRIIQSLVYRLPPEARTPLTDGLRGMTNSARRLGVAMRKSITSNGAGRPRFGPSLQYRPGDVLLQPGAGWAGHGVIGELKRAATAGCRIVTVVYDAIPTTRPEFFGADPSARFTEWLQAVVETSHLVLCISHAVKRDLAALADRWSLKCPRVDVLRLGDNSLPPAPSAVVAELRELMERPFIVCLGTIEIRKNHRLLAQVWRRLASNNVPPPRLVVIGKPGWLVLETMVSLERDPLVAPHVVHVTDASDEEVSWLVSKALFTVFPSFVEGWGLPVSECLAAGRIVVASDDPAVMEAGQGLAIHLPPDDVPAWTEMIRALADDPDRRRRLEETIRSRFAMHTWAETAKSLAGHVTRLATDAPLEGPHLTHDNVEARHG